MYGTELIYLETRKNTPVLMCVTQQPEKGKRKTGAPKLKKLDSLLSKCRGEQN